jgi:hypothetical protein
MVQLGWGHETLQVTEESRAWHFPTATLLHFIYSCSIYFLQQLYQPLLLSACSVHPLGAGNHTYLFDLRPAHESKTVGVDGQEVKNSVDPDASTGPIRQL